MDRKKKFGSPILIWFIWILFNSMLFLLLYFIEKDLSSPIISCIALFLIFISVFLFLRTRKPIPPSKEERLLNGMGYSHKSMSWAPGSTNLSDLLLSLFLGWIRNPPYQVQARKEWWDWARSVGWVVTVILGATIGFLVSWHFNLSTEVPDYFRRGLFGLGFGLFTGYVLSRLVKYSKG